MVYVTISDHSLLYHKTSVFKDRGAAYEQLKELYILFKSRQAWFPVCFFRQNTQKHLIILEIFS